ncbi:uncharacterized protein LOC113234537 [Hyposmocoma kahamanoa]|uniref:uncharacterized protein LOC113234537 n=1 Tax=Hyposmocoma kahamanoa TaxID=1477025 RepID=UPI000E6D7A48|nr:uncharacterized protein LOC113234537 [Hyposmocoma kahamanoa]
MNAVNKLEKYIFISNPDKNKECPPVHYNFSGTVIDFPIGYNCLTAKDISVKVVDMLKATFRRSNVDRQINSYDLLKEFGHHEPNNDEYLISASDRNLINTHYYNECGALYQSLVPPPKRRSNDPDQPISPLTFNYYDKFTWPLGVIMYTVVPELRGTADHTALKKAITTIELSSCVVFQFIDLTGEVVLVPKNVLVFDIRGQDIPSFGFVEGQQTLRLADMVHGCRGHTAHTLNTLFRILGIPMTSNRFDRDNYIHINWKNVIKGKEHVLEKVPEEAFVHYIPYEFESVTHAPANFMCQNCDLGANTVEPIQDLLWQRTLLMGHRTVLANSDVLMLRLVYGRECVKRNGNTVSDSPLEDKGKGAVISNQNNTGIPVDKSHPNQAISKNKLIGTSSLIGTPFFPGIGQVKPIVGQAILSPDKVDQIGQNQIFPSRY